MRIHSIPFEFSLQFAFVNSNFLNYKAKVVKKFFVGIWLEFDGKKKKDYVDLFVKSDKTSQGSVSTESQYLSKLHFIQVLLIKATHLRSKTETPIFGKCKSDMATLKIPKEY